MIGNKKASIDRYLSPQPNLKQGTKGFQELNDIRRTNEKINEKLEEFNQNMKQ